MLGCLESCRVRRCLTVDAKVLSEPTKPQPDSRVVDWLTNHESDRVVDAIIVGELRLGILLLPAGAKRQKLEAWLDGGVQRLHCVSWDGATGATWASLLATLRRKGIAMPIKDSLIAATALHHDFTVVTRNAGDFTKAGVHVLDPFSA